jgi:ubiquitin
MDIEKELSHITAALNLITAELKALNNNLKPKKAESPEYYRILNPEATNKRENIKVSDIKVEDNVAEKKQFENTAKKREKNLSLAFMESSVSRDYLMKRLSYAANMGKGRDVSKILNKYEAIRFTDLKPRYYKEVLREVEGLINGKTITKGFN